MKLYFQNITRFKTLFAVAALSLGLLSLSSNDTCAQSDVGCDTKVWTAMTNQAALETRRQDIMNKRYIVKADSVLQYSCLESELLRVSEQTGKIFSNGEQFVGRDVDLLDGFFTPIDIYNTESETVYGTPETPDGFDIRPGPGHQYKILHRPDLLTPDSLYEAILLSVFVAYEAYIDGSFNHLVLSGTTPLVSAVNPPPLCHQMAEVWQAAKCKNFDGVDMFLSLGGFNHTGLYGEFVEGFIEAEDPRVFPPSMPCEL